MKSHAALDMTAVPEIESGWTLAETGRTVDALQQVEAMYPSVHASGDRHGLATLETQIAWFSLQLGKPEAGLQAGLSAMRRWQALGEREQEARACAVYAWLLLEMGLVDESYSQAVHALTLAETGRDPRSLAFAKNAKAITYLFAGQDHLALPLLAEARDLTPSPSDRALYLVNIAYAQSSLAEVAQAEGDSVAARQFLDESIATNDLAIEVASICGDLWNLRTALCNGAECYLIDGNQHAAADYLAQWERIEGHVGLRERNHYYYTKSDLLVAVGDLELALEFALAANALAAANNQASHKANAAKQLSAVYEAMGQHDKALELHKAYHQAYLAHMGEVTRRRAQFVEMELETERLKQQAASLEHEARRDGLTGLLNRRSLEATLERMANEPFCLAMVDLDHFKTINDSFSHRIGDEVLKASARIFEDFSESFSAFRMGGEEFVLIFPGKGLAACHAIADRLRRAIEGADWSNVADGLLVSASIGLAQKQDGMLGTALLEQADKLMYEAKRRGRNMVISRLEND